MANSSQLLKGILEGCILKIISKNETYGYELYSSLKESGFDDLSEGTLYPLLIRLEKNGFLSSVSRNSPLGPKRKYYSLTKLGQEELLDFCSSWSKVSKSVEKILRSDLNE
ncbi:PadR family transcriptional regulator [Clostridium saccharobutylicum]|uniref:Transcriptional regulator, PadR-like family n=1 Tax=Clostridium saccharobutylicum DSM 13864 TaxID=1345695 RepID=U5MQT8_CLOSA|nr:PadR family transcriptional regulator [Clostridium saccharobutylicum]AGX42940.1 transcriptional regulator, PadR-like family [Clostridium saccharobutylicum DSM 13864]AQR90233.1 lineage-specific thermal regulator protein [Clostridium saccharobutylicum]AQS00139.1 lineage-specific thermal regulator protein [Clostridium saccharobutylicum]AQS09936.1 lineage-specific thermal regulator protein [Clostridium saccharobutylicum]AQS14122.1 lineage-specific thermal regulator protein [Clostridium saccharo